MLSFNEFAPEETPKVPVPNTFGTAEKFANTDFDGLGIGCVEIEGLLKNGDSVGVGPKLSGNHCVPLGCSEPGGCSVAGWSATRPKLPSSS